MADDVNALAQEYFDFLLTAWPSWGHLMGNYEHVDRSTTPAAPARRPRWRVDVGRSRTGPRRSTPTGLSIQDAITREMLVFDGRRNA